MAEQAFVAKGGGRCEKNPVRYEYTRPPFEVHHCLRHDCTAVSGGVMPIIAVVEKNAFKIVQRADMIKSFDTKPTCYRKFCGTCGGQMYLHVDAFPDFELVHVPTLDRASDVGLASFRWIFADSKHPMINVPQDGLPRHAGWAATSRTA